MDQKDTPNDKAKQKPRNFYTEKLKKASKPSPKSKGQYPNTKDKGGGPGETSKDGEKSSFHGKNGGQNQRQRQGYLQQHGLFPEYMPPPQVIAGLKDKTLIEGVLRINAKSYEDAFISSPDPKEQDIYIKGILARNRSLNGDVVVVSLDSPDKWKVNHGAIQDFVEMRATEKERSLLMDSCVVNVKEEKTETGSGSKFVNENINIKSIAGHYDKKATVKKDPDVIDIVSSDDETEEAGVNAVPAAIIVSAKDPLLDIPEAEASDYETEEVEEAEDKISVDKEVLEKLTDLSLGGRGVIVEVEDSDSGDDVVVETTEGDTTYETAVESTVDTTMDSTDRDVDRSSESGSSSKKKRSRRGKRGKKKSGVDSSLDTSMAASVASVASSARSGVRRLKPSKPLVEYNILTVLKFPRWPELGFVQKTGKVVSIKELNHCRLAAGFLKPMSDGNPNFLLFSPTDSRVPRLKIPMSQAPPNFKTRPELYDGVMFMASLYKWDKVSMALGRLEKSLGHSSDIGVRTEAILLENNIDHTEFSEPVLNDLPQNYETWSIPEKECQRRRDFRPECVFTIDPATARDLDDALSVTEVSDGVYRVGVHIADVSYFVRSGSALDAAALSRATSTYLVERVVPMLPRPLCEKLCSLNPHEDRLTFSVEWTVNSRAEILSEWFGRSVIRSCAKLSYEDAQCLIDKGTVTGVSVAEPHSLETVSKAVQIMNKLAVQLRARREEQGALRLDQPKLCFTLNPDTGLPDGFKLHQHRDSNKMIEEFMLLANMAVARKIYTTFPDVAVLRRHPDPKMDLLDKMIEQLSFLGVKIDGLTSSALSQSINRIKASGDEDKLAVVTSLCSKPMELARYFCTGLYEPHDYHHYALNVPLYTHFTSPIRRYPDILVHRLLDIAVRGQKSQWKQDEVEKAAKHCNDRRLAAKKAGEASAELFLALFIAECGPLNRVGVVTDVKDHAVDVLVMEMGVTKRVYMDRCGVTRYSFRRTSGVSFLDMFWDSGARLTLSIMTRVSLVLSKGDRDFDFIAVIEKPEGDNKAQDVITID